MSVIHIGRGNHKHGGGDGAEATRALKAGVEGNGSRLYNQHAANWNSERSQRPLTAFRRIMASSSLGVLTTLRGRSWERAACSASNVAPHERLQRVDMC